MQIVGHGTRPSEVSRHRKARRTRRRYRISWDWPPRI